MAEAKPTRYVGEWHRDSWTPIPWRKVVETQIIGDGKEGTVSIEMKYLIEKYDETNDEHVQSWERQQYGW